ncbi:MAG: hypothetical protein JRN68_06675 [Nitrososphaerota archaeon]|nr:hypothetical protein [Nitrososphaerota archaeon]
MCTAFSAGLAVVYLDYTTMGYPRIALVAGVFSIVLSMVALISLAAYMKSQPRC